jgi:hypothetical protein
MQERGGVVVAAAAPAARHAGRAPQHPPQPGGEAGLAGKAGLAGEAGLLSASAWAGYVAGPQALRSRAAPVAPPLPPPPPSSVVQRHWDTLDQRCGPWTSRLTTVQARLLGTLTRHAVGHSFSPHIRHFSHRRTLKPARVSMCPSHSTAAAVDSFSPLSDGGAAFSGENDRNRSPLFSSLLFQARRGAFGAGASLRRRAALVVSLAFGHGSTVPRCPAGAVRRCRGNLPQVPSIVSTTTAIIATTSS